MYFRKHGKIEGSLEAFCTEEGCKLQLHLTWTKVLIAIKSTAVSVTAPSAFSMVAVTFPGIHFAALPDCKGEIAYSQTICIPQDG